MFEFALFGEVNLDFARRKKLLKKISHLRWKNAYLRE